MFLKFRYRLGYESVCAEVADSIGWRRFTRIVIDGKVPHPTTLMKITTRCGSEVIEQLNEALLAKATEGKLLRVGKVRADTTVVSANVDYPTDAGLLAKAVRRIGRIVRRVKATGAATGTRCPDHTRAAGRRARQIASKLRLRGAQAKDEAQQVVRQATAALARLASRSAADAQAVLRNARRALRTATGRRGGQLRRAVNDLAATVKVTTVVAAQARSRFAGDVAFEAADGLALGLAFGEASLDIGAGVRVPTQPGQDDAVESSIRLTVAASVEPAAFGLAGGGVDGADAAQGGEGSFAVEPVGVVAGGDEHCRGAVLTDAVAFEQLRVVGVDCGGNALFEVADLLGQVQDSLGEAAKGVDGGANNVVGRCRVEVSAAAYESAGTQPGQGLPQCRVRADKDRLQLVDCLGTGLERRCLGQLEHADHLHRPVTGLGRGAGTAGQDRLGGGFRVDGVGLAAPAARGLVREVNLDHLDAGASQMAGQRGAVGAAAFHTGTAQRAEAAGPRQQLAVANGGGWERLTCHEHAQRGDHRADVAVLVRINAQDHLISIAVVA